MLLNENTVNDSIIETAAPDLVEVDYNNFEQLKIAKLMCFRGGFSEVCP